MVNAGRTSLKDKHTFHMDVWCANYIPCNSDDELKLYLREAGDKAPILVLGEGSNVIFTKDFEGTVLQLTNREIRVLSETDDQVIVFCGAGCNWDDFVHYTVLRGWGGLENLSGIPGTVGACPIQNIGAYGAEVKNTIVSVRGVFRNTADSFELSADECQFGYRNSIFKNTLKNIAIITGVTFRLKKPATPDLSYKDLRETLANTPSPGIAQVRQAVLDIRQRKLPDPKVIGNSGSFFKNPIVDQGHWELLQKEFSTTIPMYPADLGQVKIPAAYLIEQCGWKGYRRGDAGVHPFQPLVLVNYGGASGKEVLNLANEIIDSVYSRFRIKLTPEVNIL